jgi:hypothetical protein
MGVQVSDDEAFIVLYGVNPNKFFDVLGLILLAD